MTAYKLVPEPIDYFFFTVIPKMKSPKKSIRFELHCWENKSPEPNMMNMVDLCKYPKIVLIIILY